MIGRVVEISTRRSYPADQCGCDTFENVKNVLPLELCLKPLRPKLKTVLMHQLGGDSKAVTLPRDRAVDQKLHTQVRGDLRYGERLRSYLKAGSLGNNAKSIGLVEGINHLVSQSSSARCT